ncbi:EAL and HDOD domain-containing protein [Oxalobacteraceae bacterium A2-2]
MTPLVFLQPLADRNGQPGALLFSAATAGSQPADWPLHHLQELCSAMGCYYPADTEAAVAEALRQAGWQALAPARLQRVDGSLDEVSAGAVWLAGDWYLAPPPKAVGAQAASRALALQLVQLVTADADTHEIEALLRKDATLSYHLLKLVNSLGMGTGRRVTSFAQAILILGRAQLRRWLNLMLFSSRQGDNRSAMLLARVAVRAHAMEALARALGEDRQQQEQAFMAGMFSLLGVLFGMPLEDVLKPLAISPSVQQALLEQAGPLGALLALLESAEAGDAPALAAHLQALGLAHEDFNRLLIDAYLWMQGVSAGKGGVHA